MNKVVQSVLVRNDLSDEDIAKALEGIDKRDEKKFSTYTAYQQVSVHKCEEESLIVQKHEEVDGIFFVLGDLADGTGDAGTLQVEVNEKEAVDYATMDNLYSELYAMADVVGGAMRQENADADFRKTTILTTIDNFRAFAEVVLENLSEKMLAKGVNPEDHPDLVVDILHAPAASNEEDELTDEEKKAKEEADKAAEEEAKKAAEAAASEGEGDSDAPKFDEFISQFTDSLNNFGDKLVESITASTKEVQESNKKTVEVMDKVVEKVEEMQNTTVASKTEKDEELENPNDSSHVSQSDKLFKGTFFRSMSDFR